MRPDPRRDTDADAPRPVPVTAAETVQRGLTGEDLRSAFEHAPIGVAVLDVGGVVAGCNRALGRLLGRPGDSLVGRTLFGLTHEDDLPLARSNCAAIGDGTVALVTQECRFVHADGTVLWARVSTARVPDGPGRPAHLVMHVEDVTARRALEEELNRRALHDPLTGLPNRTLLLDRIGQAMARAARDGRPVTVLFLDLDGFKQVNDAHGHAAGDRVLVELAARLRQELRPGDTPSRLGGDEFAVLCDDTDEAGARNVADRLRKVASRPFDLEGTLVRLGAAVGVAGGTRLSATPPVDGRGGGAAERLLHLADLDMYRAKRARRAGRDRRPYRRDGAGGVDGPASDDAPGTGG